MEGEKVSTLRAILGLDIPQERLQEILEASNGSVEGAIDVYFHQEQDRAREGMQRSIECIDHVDVAAPAVKLPHCTPTAKPGKTRIDADVAEKIHPKKRSPPKTASLRGGRSSAPKQARLDSFFSVGKFDVSSPKKSFGAQVVSSSDPQSSDAAVAAVSVDMVRKSHDCISTRGATEVTDIHPIQRIVSSNIAGAKSMQLACLVSENSNIERTIPGTGASKRNSADNSYTQSCSSDVTSFRRFSQVLQEMADTTKRVAKLSALESFIRDVTHSREHGCTATVQTLAAALELVLGGRTLAPLNVSGSAVSQAIQTSFGVSRNQLSKAYRQYGDLGDCAASFLQKRTYFVIQSSIRHLSILDVSQGLRKISDTNGGEAKQHVILHLLRGCQSKTEVRFLIRLLVRNMRIGANLKTCLAALAMSLITNQVDTCSEAINEPMSVKEAIALVQTTHDLCPNLEKIVYSLLQGGFKQMKQDCSIEVMTPIAPMLAHPIHSFDEILAAMRDKDGDSSEIQHAMVMEWKYDGMRCQAHFDGTNVKLYSRHMLEITNQFPDVVTSLLEAWARKNVEIEACETIGSFIIDAEIVGVKEEEGRTCLLPFQDLSTRRKKQDDGLGIRVKVFAFDLMFLSGESYICESLATRQDALRRSFNETSEFAFVASQMLPSFDETAIQKFLSEAIASGAEGLMMKSLGRDSAIEGKATVSSKYEAGTRSRNWLKVKRDYVAGFADTIDVVPIGAWYGNGRKAQKSFLSPVLLAVYDDEEDTFRSICRCMSFTDAMYEGMREFYFRGVPYPKNIDADESVSVKVAPTLKSIVQRHDGDDHGDVFLEDNESDGDGCSSDAPDGVEDDIEAYPMKVEGKEEEFQKVNCFLNRPSSAFVVTNESPSIWFKPMEVFEVSFADLSLSRKHTAAAGLVGEDGRGVALRFPRFKRRRPDKKPEQATTSIEIAQLFAKQAKIGISAQF